MRLLFAESLGSGTTAKRLKVDRGPL